MSTEITVVDSLQLCLVIFHWSESHSKGLNKSCFWLTFVLNAIYNYYIYSF